MHEFIKSYLAICISNIRLRRMVFVGEEIKCIATVVVQLDSKEKDVKKINSNDKVAKFISLGRWNGNLGAE